MSITTAHGDELQSLLLVRIAARIRLLPARPIHAAQIGIMVEIAVQRISSHRGAALHTNRQEVVDLLIPAADHAAAEAVAQDHQHLEEVVAGPVAINRGTKFNINFLWDLKNSGLPW
jgi:hypothetical protein